MKVQDTHKYLEKGFSQAKDWYEKYGTMTSNKLYDEYLAFMHMKEATNVLETGSGPGNGVSRILAAVNPSCKLHATDISPEFLKKLSEIQAENYTSGQANFESLPFPDNTFDRYISNMAIHNASNLQLAFQEALRVLRPGGMLGVSVFGANEETNTYMGLMKVFRQFINQPYHESLLANLQLSGFPDPFRNFVRQIGFRNVISYGVNTVYPFSTPEEARDLYMSFYPIVGFMKANPDKAKDLENLVMEKLHECLVVKGKPIGYEGIILIARK